MCHSHSKGFTAYNNMLNSYHQGLEPNKQTKGPALIQKFNLQIIILLLYFKYNCISIHGSLKQYLPKSPTSLIFGLQGLEPHTQMHTTAFTSDSYLTVSSF